MAQGARTGSIDTTLPPLAERDVAADAYRYYALAVIWLVLLLRTVDQQIISVLLEPIRKEFHVSDTKLGLLSGTAFALFYALLGLPVALLADRRRRRTIIATCLALWSAMTAVCGMATSFGALLLARVGVGVGEAGGAPPSYSLISDYFPPERRSTIFALLNTSVPVGVFCGYIIGGYVNANFGWRATLMAIGLFGIGIAVIVRFTVREPVRGGADPRPVVAASGAPALNLGDTVPYLWAKRSYRHLVCGTSVATLGGFGSGVWMLSFFVRVHHLAPAQVATWLAFIYGGCGIIGAMMGGAVADRLARRRGDRRWHGWIPALALGSILPFALVVFLWPVATIAFAALVGVVLLMHAWMGPAYGTVQSLAPPSGRAMAAAINLLVVNLLALGCGPLLVGAMSDYFNARFGEEAIRYAILSLVAVAYSWAAIHFLLASRTLREELQS